MNISKSDQHSIIEYLRSQHHRLTPQRLLVLEIIQSTPCHLSADQLHAAVIQRHPYVNLATIYRTLQWLEDLGIVAPIQVNGEPLRYEYIGGSEHHHLVCQGCGMQQQIDGSIFDTLKSMLLERYGFAAKLSHLALMGQCAICRDEAGQAGEDHGGW